MYKYNVCVMYVLLLHTCMLCSPHSYTSALWAVCENIMNDSIHKDDDLYTVIFGTFNETFQKCIYYICLHTKFKTWEQILMNFDTEALQKFFKTLSSCQN
jgi:hypothetical protein